MSGEFICGTLGIVPSLTSRCADLSDNVMAEVESGVRIYYVAAVEHVLYAITGKYNDYPPKPFNLMRALCYGILRWIADITPTISIVQADDNLECSLSECRERLSDATNMACITLIRRRQIGLFLSPRSNVGTARLSVSTRWCRGSSSTYICSDKYPYLN